jgi:hypothetical protein
MKTLLSGILFFLTVSGLTAQTTYTINTSRSWSNGGINTLPNPCYNCVLNLAADVTITLDADLTLQNATINGGKIVANGKKITLWTSNNKKTYFNNVVFEFGNNSGITASAPLILTNTTMNFSGNAYIITQHAASFTSSQINLSGNSYYLATGGPVDLKSNSHIIAGDGTLASNAYIMISGPVLNIYDNASGINLGNLNNYYFNWSPYNSIPNNTSYVTKINTLNCGGANQHSCVPPYVYGPSVLNASGMSGSLILPVVLTDFSAYAMSNNTVSLSWSTQQERNADFFEIQRSANGTDWTVIGKQSARGTTGISQHYSFTDAAPSKAVAYYRLKMVDIDLKYAYSAVKAVRMDAAAALKVFPNPATDYVNISFEKSAAGNKVQLLNQFGQVLTEKTASGNTVLTLSLSQYANGAYVVRVINANGTEKSTKLMVNHK